MSPIDQAARFVEKYPPAISGQGGHDQTFKLACILIHGFALSRGDAERLLAQYNHSCQPSWSERELTHKLDDAERTRHDKPRGHMLRNSSVKSPRTNSGYTMATKTTKAAATPKSDAKRYVIEGEVKLPDPIPDGARMLLRTAFRPGEGIRIAPATLNDEGKEIPADAGVCLSLEEWERKLAAKGGNPNGIWKSSKKTGIYVSVNPMKPGGSKDSDVTAFRHILVEFDNISPQEQWNIYIKSNLPCVAIINSGGKSIHAWVKVDAKDRKEYDERREIVYSHFKDCGFELDPKNKNPSRFSRFPNCERFNKRQELLAINVGAESFTEWVKQIEGDSLGACRRLDELLDLDTSKDPNCVIGFHDGKSLRYLCRGKAAWMIGPSGLGKSSLMTEFAIGWAQGKAVFGITPARPLKSLIIQAENDDYDLAEMAQGICRAYKIDKDFNESEFEIINKNIVWKTETTSIRQDFIDRLHKLIDRERPDIVWMDPLLSFAGIDVSKQDQCTEFLRAMLNPVLEATGAVMIGVHHTGKPKGMKETQNWTAIDYAYSGLGSSELVNWARAVMVLRPVNDFQFELKLAKRGPRAGATNPDGSFTTSVWLEHGKGEIRWQQIEPPVEPERKQKGDSKGGKPNKVEMVVSMNLHSFLTECKADGEGKNEIARRLENWLAKNHQDVKPSTCKTIIERLVETQKITKSEDGKYKKGSNA